MTPADPVVPAPEPAPPHWPDPPPAPGAAARAAPSELQAAHERAAATGGARDLAQYLELRRKPD